MIKIRNDGFSLLELSVVIVIIALILSLSLSVGSARLEAHRVKITKQKMEVITEAIKVFVLTHKRLPCPAQPKEFSVDNKEFGWEVVLSSEQCDETKIFKGGLGNITGAVPVRDLGISPIMAIDGWDNFITYTTNQRLVKNVSYIHSSKNDANRFYDWMDIYNTQGEGAGEKFAVATNDVFFILISGGPNKSFVYTSKGNFLFGGTADPPEGEDEYVNYDISGDDDYIQRLPTQYDAEKDTYFDDIVEYRSKLQMPRLEEQ